MKNHKIAKNSTATKAGEKNNHRFGILRIEEKIFMHARLNLKTNKFCLLK
jgi:hypothetical protein